VKNSDAESGIRHIQRLLTLADFAFPYITTSGMNWRWAAGHLQLAHGIAATCSLGMVAMALFPFEGHFTLAKAALPDHPQSLMSGLVSLRRSILCSMLSVSSSHTKTPNQSIKPMAEILSDISFFTEIFGRGFASVSRLTFCSVLRQTALYGDRNRLQVAV